MPGVKMRHILVKIICSVPECAFLANPSCPRLANRMGASVLLRRAYNYYYAGVSANFIQCPFGRLGATFVPGQTRLGLAATI